MSQLRMSLPVIALCSALSGSAYATEIGTGAHAFGLGVAIGEPTGLSGKYYFGSTTGLEVVLASYYGNGGVYAHGTYLWHPSVLASEPAFELPWHVGVGGFVQDGYDNRWSRWNNGWNGGTAIGGRGQLGLDMNLNDVRLQISGDIGLNMGIYARGGLFYDLDFYLTVRYFF